MNNPPFWSHSQPPRHPYYYYSPSPVFQTQQPVQHNPARKPSSSAPKVVQIPVQFINSEPAQPVVPARSKSESAVKIQKVFRGFWVRKSLKKIKVIKKEVEDIEWRVSTSEYVELLRENERERLKVNEMLMGLLFKLDSIRGFGSGVRDCRKGVIKKAIAIQERVDAIVATKIDESEVTGASDKPVDQKEENRTEMHQSEEQKEGSVTTEAENAVNEGSKSEEYEQKEGATQCSEEQNEDSVRIEVGNAENEASEGGEVEKIRASSKDERDGLDECEVVEDEKVETRADDTSVEEKDAGVDLEMKAEGEGCDEKEEKGMWGESEGVKMSDTEDEKVETRREEEEGCDEKEEGMCGERECVDEGGECEAEDEKIETRGKEEEEEGCDEKEKGLWDMSDTENVDGGGESRVEDEKAETGGEEEEEEHEGCDAKENEMWDESESVDEGGEKKNDDMDAKERNTELLERMMEDHAKMMSLMTQLFERNEMQTRMLNSLTQRVEQLEKAFMCDKMRRKKKKRHAA